MFKKSVCFNILFLVYYVSDGQVSLTRVGKNYVELEMYNPDSLAKQTINPYFLGFGKRNANEFLFKLFDHRVQLHKDTLFLYLNDTAIVPGIEKYNFGDSLRLKQVEKYDTLNFKLGFKAKYVFPKKKYSKLVIYYLFNDLMESTRKSKFLFIDRKRRKE